MYINFLINLLFECEPQHLVTFLLNLTFPMSGKGLPSPLIHNPSSYWLTQKSHRWVTGHLFLSGCLSAVTICSASLSREGQVCEVEAWGKDFLPCLSLLKCQLLICHKLCDLAVFCSYLVFCPCIYYLCLENISKQMEQNGPLGKKS